jgi:hypothetical protein
MRVMLPEGAGDVMVEYGGRKDRLNLRNGLRGFTTRRDCTSASLTAEIPPTG